LATDQLLLQMGPAAGSSEKYAILEGEPLPALTPATVPTRKQVWSWKRTSSGIQPNANQKRIRSLR
jgi:hypothetical protein